MEPRTPDKSGGGSDRRPETSPQSISSWDVIPSPHNRSGSLNGPPRGHPEYRSPPRATQASGHQQPPETATRSAPASDDRSGQQQQQRQSEPSGYYAFPGQSQGELVPGGFHQMEYGQNISPAQHQGEPLPGGFHPAHYGYQVAQGPSSQSFPGYQPTESSHFAGSQLSSHEYPPPVPAPAPGYGQPSGMTAGQGYHTGSYGASYAPEHQTHQSTGNYVGMMGGQYTQPQHSYTGYAGLPAYAATSQAPYHPGFYPGPSGYPPSQPAPPPQGPRLDQMTQEQRMMVLCDQVETLLNPPAEFNHDGNPGTVTFGLPWVHTVLGAEQMQWSSNLKRMVLSSNSPLRTIGEKLGLPKEYVRWLVGARELQRVSFTTTRERLASGAGKLQRERDRLARGEY